MDPIRSMTDGSIALNVSGIPPEIAWNVGSVKAKQGPAETSPGMVSASGIPPKIGSESHLVSESTDTGEDGILCGKVGSKTSGID